MAITRKQAQSLDRFAIESLGLPGVVLMENAAINAAAAAVDLLDDALDKRPAQAKVCVVCGGGNNGGDGYALARHLHVWGCTDGLTLVALKPLAALTNDALINAQVCEALGIAVINGAALLSSAEGRNELQAVFAEADLLVDGILGTGFCVEGSNGVLKADASAIVSMMNAVADQRMPDGGPFVLALDLPSGLDCDTGRPAEPTVTADLTVSFVDRKAGFNAEGAERFTGRVVVADVGIPPDLVAEA